jgi:hypothetical protein
MVGKRLPKVGEIWKYTYEDGDWFYGPVSRITGNESSSPGYVIEIINANYSGWRNCTTVYICYWGVVEGRATYEPLYNSPLYRAILGTESSSKDTGEDDGE